MPAPTLNSLTITVRQLSAMLSPSQITDSEIHDNINFVLQYAFPQRLQTFRLHTTFSFLTQPYIASYTSDSFPGQDADNFKNNYLAFMPPATMGGFPMSFTTEPGLFYGAQNAQQFVQPIGTGDGVNILFEGTLPNPPLLRNKVLFNSITSGDAGISVYDLGGGLLFGDGLGDIDYVTGEYSFQFTTPPAAGAVVNSQTVSYFPSRPRSVLYYDYEFTFWPVPDQVYEFQILARRRPEEILGDAGPELEQWADYIAYSAATRILLNRRDKESADEIRPRYLELKDEVLTTTILQDRSRRIHTIYDRNNIVTPRGGYMWGAY